jgi:hypothetical protein
MNVYTCNATTLDLTTLVVISVIVTLSLFSYTGILTNKQFMETLTNV